MAHLEYPRYWDGGDFMTPGEWVAIQLNTPNDLWRYGRIINIGPNGLVVVASPVREMNVNTYIAFIPMSAITQIVPLHVDESAKRQTIDNPFLLPSERRALEEKAQAHGLGGYLG